MKTSRYWKTSELKAAIQMIGEAVTVMDNETATVTVKGNDVLKAVNKGNGTWIVRFESSAFTMLDGVNRGIASLNHRYDNVEVVCTECGSVYRFGDTNDETSDLCPACWEKALAEIA